MKVNQLKDILEDFTYIYGRKDQCNQNGNPSSIFVFILFHSGSDTSEIIYKI